MMRQILNPGEKLRLFRHGGADDWMVTGYVGEGGSSVCYTARGGGKMGRLKEFYPLGISEARRLASGALEMPEDLPRQFAQCYETLERIREEDPAAVVLNNFIPPFELLRGGAGGIYVWTPDDKQGVSFEDYLTRVWEDPEEAPEHKLYNILNTVLTLTDCIRAFHGAGLLHLDIKPSNFLVLYDGEYNINPNSISMFDINTLQAIDSPFVTTAGSGGYMAPEVARGDAENRSDIYSIGAMLFRAVAFQEPGQPRYFRREDYDRLDTLVASSALIRASETNSNVFLRHTLGRILKKCLAYQPRGRYECCEDLMEDLRQARTFLLPEVAGDDLGYQKRLAVLDAEPETHCSPGAVMQDLLYRHPLDAGLAAGEREIRVLAVGAGTYGQKFIDICLQAGQMLDRRICITAVSQDPELDREVYLQVRPALPEFVSCNGALDKSEKEVYGWVDFVPVPVKFRKHDPAANRAAAERLTGRYHCVLVSLGDDELNREVAELLARQMEHVHFVVQADGAVTSRLAEPVYINRALTVDAIHPKLESMAFNVHLCWMETPHPDMRLAKQQFRQKYYREASLAYALSVGSKLRSLGITTADPAEAAAQFAEKMKDPACTDGLAALEHRRWVLEKVTNGWTRPADLTAGIRRGSFKDRIARTHPCIARSRPGRGLKAYTLHDWETPGAPDACLDELDRVSLTLFRGCLTAAEQLRTLNPLEQGDAAILQRRIADCPAEVRRAFERYRACLVGILARNERAAKEFDSCEQALRDSFAQLDAVLRRELLNRLGQIRREFFPAVESCLYRDYKTHDEGLTGQIPFVLTNESWDGEETGPEPWQIRRTYRPQPADTSDVVLPAGLEALAEQIAENVHDVWAAGRIREGWTYGEARSSARRTTPCLVPYDALPEEEKAYDRNTAMETLKLIVKLGYRIEKD